MNRSDMISRLFRKGPETGELQLLRAALDEAVCGVTIASADADAPIVMVNRTFERITGYERGEIVGRNCRFLQDGLPNEAARREIRETFRTGEPCRVLLRNRRKCGELFWNELRLSALRDGEGRPTHFVGVQDDVTERIETRRRHEESENRLRAVLSAAPAAILTVDHARRIIAFNPAAEKIFGWTVEEIVGRPLEDLVPVALASAHPIFASTYFAEAQAEAGPMSSLRVVEARRRDGSAFPAYVSLARHEHDGRAVVTAVVVDMSDLVAAERAAQELSEELASQLQAAEAASAAKDTFLAIASHELRTPLNGVLGMAQLLEGGDLDPAQRRFVETILTCGRALERLVGDLLEMARLERAVVTPDPAPIDLDSFLRDVASLMDAEAKSRGVEIRIRLAPVIAERPFRTDPEHLRRILFNLLSNALKFGEGAPIDVEADRDRWNRLQISVRDRGPGVPSEAMDRIFERFVQAETGLTRRYGGLGLGLAIAKQLTTLCDGEIAVENAPDGGAVFRVALPWLDGEDAPAPYRADRPAPKTGDVVVVDDDDASAEVIGAVARRAGFDVRLYFSVESALRERWSWNAPVVFVDLHMPDLTGADFIGRLRSDAAFASTPVALVTADIRMDAEAARRLGAQLCLHKPIRLEAVEDFLSADRAGAA